MALRLLSSRGVVTNQLPNRTALLSTSSVNSKQTSTELETKKENAVSGQVKKVKAKRESLMSWLSLVLPGGKMQNRDPSEPPVPADKVMLPHVVEHATGEEKLLYLAYEAGYADPYCNLPTYSNGRGKTKDNPIEIKSFVGEEMVGCVCEPNQNHIKYMILHKDEMKRCNCGFWMKIVDAPKFWLDIPKDDLLTIPYFLNLELEGKLDELLSGKEAGETPQVEGSKPNMIKSH